MRRLVVAAALVGIVNGLVAVLSVYLLSQTRGDDFGWFAYAPQVMDVAAADQRARPRPPVRVGT